MDLSISGMTCAACSTRIEKVLNRIPGVTEAVVNLATEKARITTRSGEVEPETLIRAIEKAGYGAHAQTGQSAAEDQEAETRKARRDLVIVLLSALLTLPLAAPMALALFGIDSMPSAFVQFLLATPVQFVFGARFYVGAWKSLRGGLGNMDLLVALGTSAAYGFSVWRMIVDGDHAHLYFEGSAVVITLVLLGKYLEIRARRGAASAIRALMRLRPDTALVKRDGAWMEVAVDDVLTGEIVMIKPGERSPVDGLVLSGESHMDESLLTGESMPINKAPGDKIVGGAVNGEGLLEIEATTIGVASTLARIIRLVEGAQTGKAPVQKLVDKISAIFVPAVVVIAILTFLGWVLIGDDPMQGFVAAVSVLVIACPCALGLATPTAMMVGTGVAARNGILIKDAEALETAHRVTMMILDKTGTLTEGRPVLTDIQSVDGDDDFLLRLAASAQQGSEHPLAHAIVEAAIEKKLPLSQLQSFKAAPGMGLMAVVDDQILLIGNERLMQKEGVEDLFEKQAIALEEEGRTVMRVVLDGKMIGLLAVGDALRPTAKAAIEKLREMGVAPAMLTGDNRRSAALVAQKVGISQFDAEVLPAGKAEIVARYKAEGQIVGMVGDGVNDAPALALADLGVAMGSGSDIAMHTAGVTLMRSDPALLPASLSISKATYVKIRHNLFWAMIYNVIAIPLAAAGMLSPTIAGAAMAFSSVSVVLSSLTLYRWKI